MSKDKMDPGAKKIVREKTERTKRSDARRQKPEKPGGFGERSDARRQKPEKPGGFGDLFGDLFEDMWSDLEDHEDSKKG